MTDTSRDAEPKESAAPSTEVVAVAADQGGRMAAAVRSRNLTSILSRNAAMDESTYRDIVERLRAGGYPVQKLLRTPHQPRPSGPSFAAGPMT